MSDLILCGVDDALLQALRARADARGHSAEAEHREILVAALTGPRRRGFAEILAAMPDVGEDADFARTGVRQLNPVSGTAPPIEAT